MSGSDTAVLTRATVRLSSGDALERNRGVEEVLGIGAGALPALLPLLESRQPATRAAAMYALAQIAAPETASAFQSGLKDNDEYVRSHAACGLLRIGHPDTVDALVVTLNDASDELHNDMTPSVEALGELGARAAPRLLNLLAADDEMTRLHAQRALELMVDRYYGFRPGRGFPDSSAEEQAIAVWRGHGNYRYDADASTRASAASQLRAWFDNAKER